ncbi:MAG: hypothetical protein JWQ98_384 [Chlorobi bacterium]|nr:hypothetical protein [Chlorobiota bacterium]
MYRASIILATVVALLIGSIGWPVSLYSCEMANARGSMKASCPMCNRSADPAPAKDCHGTPKKAPCCQKQHTVIHADTTATVMTAISFTPLLVALITLLVPGIDLHAIDAHGRFWIDHPPPIAHHAQAAYLFNATFLI